MSKKKKIKKGNTSQKKNVNAALWVAGAVALMMAALAVSGNLPFMKGAETGKSFSVKGGETRPVLAPSMFTGQTRAAYEAAKKYPQVLDQVYCYCYCNEPPFNHVSLLSCFVSDHGAG
jgi:hypothetical protein